MPTLTLEFEVFCSLCGAGLCSNATEGSNMHSQYISMEPCEACLDNEHTAGYDEGYARCKEDNEL